ncbi:MAG: M48 family metalloprotease, partial [Kineosporiaceae bacterium]
MTSVAFLLACVATTVIAVLLAPTVLGSARWSTRHPATALTLWCIAFAAGLLAPAVALVLVLVQTVGSGRGGAESGTAVLVAALGSWAGLAGFGGLASLILTRAEPLSADHRRSDAALTLLAATATRHREWIGRVQVLHVRSDLPLAVCLPGGGGRILLTTGLSEALSVGQRRAVIAHELAHLRGRHGWIARLVRLNAAVLPRFSGAPRFERTCGLLIELAADDAAARDCGADDVAGALRAMAALDPDEGLLLRARRVETAPP